MRLLPFFLLGALPALSQQLIVTPYVQPGNASTLQAEEKVIIWQTDNTPAQFTVEWGKNEKYGKSAEVSATPLKLGNNSYILYRAVLKDLQFDERYHYRVSMKGQPISASQFITRTKKSSTRFAVFGDCGIGTAAEAQLAYQVHERKPEFVLVTGDNVYQRGRVSEYLKNYFPYFNAAQPSPQTGAPLMRSVPFYLSIGNHDVAASDLGTYPDGLAYYYYFDLPLNAPAFPRTVNPKGSTEQLAAFRQAAGPRFPNMANYSFDHGNVHIVCLDANVYVYPFDRELVEWLENDLKKSKADWKLVAFHHPGFNSSNAHYNAQWMRALAPLFERSGVHLVLNGHVHNYQRTHPLNFDPKKDEKGEPAFEKSGRLDGRFTLDQQFDGKANKKPKGVLYIVTGAGGAGLYDSTISNKPDLWKHDPPENWVPFTYKLISHVHSFSMIETKKNRLFFRQIDVKGNLLDEIEISK